MQADSKGASPNLRAHSDLKASSENRANKGELVLLNECSGLYCLFEERWIISVMLEFSKYKEIWPDIRIFLTHTRNSVLQLLHNGAVLNYFIFIYHKYYINVAVAS